MRARADQVTKEQLIYEVQQLRGVVDALAGVSSGQLVTLNLVCACIRIILSGN